MALLLFIHKKVYSHIDPSAKLFSTYKWASLKMKLSYESHIRDCNMKDVVKNAILHTLVRQQSIAAFNLSNFLTMKHNTQHGMFTVHNDL